MPEPILVDLLGWVAAIDVPIIGGLLWLIWRQRRENVRNLAAHDEKVDETLSRSRDDLAAYKLEVAKTYTPIPYLKDVDRRLTAHLLRIEAKLDAICLPPVAAGLRREQGQ